MSTLGCVGRVLLLLLALASSAATVGLFRVGQAARWSSDGPGMLFVMLALAGCALVAVASWLGVLGSLLRRRD